ncbi:ferredoxin--NADP(+) reductase [Alsobacter metallidurans]|uniref:ferredoxin--NADP(+) reductase n=1 Tax=Alsobacter metallidurans TaxID=340221 RepID=A0A917I963_9HYPH|nr:ferredoxin--NADP reductase [Alsobacter metallidurans]GGH22156.1 ferredoxin--NADP(+) reductase [Alsobacter metallidurans]
MAAFDFERVLLVEHWTDRLFSFRTTRNPTLRFENGQFAMIGLKVDGRPLLRAYSFASANYEEYLEFYSIKVPEGPLTSRLQHIKVGDEIIVGHKPTGTLIQSNLLPGKRLFMFATGTGLAPFASIMQDPEVYDRYEKIVMVHGCREIAELAYGQRLVRGLPENEYFGDVVKDKLVYYPTTTREPFVHMGRVTDLIQNGKLFADTGLAPLDPEHDRVMLCGSPQMLADLRVMLDAMAFTEGSTNTPGSYVIERAFVDK